MLTSNKYSFDCGLKVGMTEEELDLIDLPFQKYAREETVINVGSIMFGGDAGPLTMVEYYNIYCFDQGCMNYWEAKAYLSVAGIPTEGFISLPQHLTYKRKATLHRVA
jgi:hypothetical protein